MAITPMPLPSPKAYDPDQMEIANLSLLKDPYTVDGARLEAMMLASNRKANNQAYSHAVEGQQDYYNRALQAQADESAYELIPKLLHEANGVGFIMGHPNLQGVLGRMQQNAPGLYSQYVNQAFQTEASKNLQSSGAGAYSAAQAGLQVPPSEFLQASGVNTNQITPLGVQIAGINAASSGGGGDEGKVRISAGLPSVDGVSPNVSFKAGTPEHVWKGKARESGLFRDRVDVPLPFNPNAKPGQQQKSAPPEQGTKPTGSPSPPAAPRGGQTVEQRWDQTRKSLPAHYKPLEEAVERARRMNNGKVVVQNGRVVGADPTGKPVDAGPL